MIAQAVQMTRAREIKWTSGILSGIIALFVLRVTKYAHDEATNICVDYARISSISGLFYAKKKTHQA
jgi:hypothetical protein